MQQNNWEMTMKIAGYPVAKSVTVSRRTRTRGRTRTRTRR